MPYLSVMEQKQTPRVYWTLADKMMSTICGSHTTRNHRFSNDQRLHTRICIAIRDQDREALEQIAENHVNPDMCNITQTCCVIDTILIAADYINRCHN